MRYEDSDQMVKTFELYTAEPEIIESPLHTKDVPFFSLFNATVSMYT